MANWIKKKRTHYDAKREDQWWKKKKGITKKKEKVAIYENNQGHLNIGYIKESFKKLKNMFKEQQWIEKFIR